MAPGTEVKPPMMSTGKRLQRQEGDGELHAELGAPDGGRNQRDQAGDQPDHEPDPADGDADRLRRGVVVGNGAQRAARLGVLEEDGKARHQHAGDQTAPDVELVDQNAARENALADDPGVGGKSRKG